MIVCDIMNGFLFLVDTVIRYGPMGNDGILGGRICHKKFAVRIPGIVLIISSEWNLTTHLLHFFFCIEGYLVDRYGT